MGDFLFYGILINYYGLNNFEGENCALTAEKRFRKNDNVIYGIVILYLVAILCRYTPGSFLLYNASIYMCFVACVVWLVYVRIRIVEKRQRYLLFAIGILLVFLHLSQICKYSIFSGIDTVERMLWYAYYIPTTMVPVISLWLSVVNGSTRREKLPVYIKILLVLALVQIILIMTNDLHQLVFSFNKGIENWSRDYSHGIVFYINTAWSYLLIFASFLIILQKSFQHQYRKAAITGLLIAVLHYAINLILFFDTSDNLKVFGVVPITAPMLYSMTFILFWESMIHFRLIPSNTGYGEIFDIADISAVIRDKSGRKVHESQARIGERTENIKRHRKEILGGEISWIEDLTTISNLNRSLEEVGDELRQGYGLLIEEANVKAKRAKLKVKNEVYEEIGSYMSPHFDIIEKSLEGAEELPEEEFRKRLGLVCFEACFVKRGSNLLLATKTGEVIKTEDFAIAMREILDSANRTGISCEIEAFDMEALNNRQMIDTFEYAQKHLFKAIEEKKNIKLIVHSEPESAYETVYLDDALQET
jgi:hypothetical protein